MGDVRINIMVGVRIDQPSNTFAPFAVIHLGSNTDIHDIAVADYTDLATDSGNATTFAATASSALPWYSDLTDADPAETTAQNAANAKDRFRLGFSKLKSWTP